MYIVYCIATKLQHLFFFFGGGELKPEKRVPQLTYRLSNYLCKIPIHHRLCRGSDEEHILFHYWFPWLQTCKVLPGDPGLEHVEQHIVAMQELRLLQTQTCTNTAAPVGSVATILDHDSDKAYLSTSSFRVVVGSEAVQIDVKPQESGEEASGHHFYWIYAQTANCCCCYHGSSMLPQQLHVATAVAGNSSCLPLTAAGQQPLPFGTPTHGMLYFQPLLHKQPKLSTESVTSQTDGSWLLQQECLNSLSLLTLPCL